MTFMTSLLADAKSFNFDHVKVSAFGARVAAWLLDASRQIASQLETEGAWTTRQPKARGKPIRAEPSSRTRSTGFHVCSAL